MMLQIVKHGQRINKWALLSAICCAAFVASSSQAAPANDNFASATNLGASPTFTVTGDTTGAGTEAGEPNSGGNGHTIWFKWTAPATQNVQINTLNRGLGLNFQVNVYTAQVPSSPTVNKLTFVSGTLDGVVFTATANTSYYIQVDSTGNDGSVNLNLPPAPANDNLANATDLGSVASFSVAGTTIGATSESGEVSNGNGISVWYKWTAPVTGKIQVNTLGNPALELAVYTSTATPATIATLKPAASVSGSGSAQVAVIQGTVYFFQADSNSDPMPFTFSVPPAPGNDAFANATDLSNQAGFNVFGNTTGATTETGEPPSAGVGATVWFKWTSPFTKKTQFDTFGSDNFSQVDVYTGSAVNNLAIAVGVTTNGNDSHIFNAVSGQQYFIRLDSSVPGIVALNLDNPINDNFANAIALSGTSITGILGDTTNATKELNEPNHGNDPGGASLWYKWTAPVAGLTTISQAVPTGTSPALSVSHSLAVYTGTAVNALTLVPNATAAPANNSSVTFTSVAGSTYYIAIDGIGLKYGGAFGPFTLGLSCVVAPSNDNFANATAITGANFTVPGTTTGATLENGESSSGGGLTVWYKWTAPASVNFVLTAINAGNGNQLNYIFDVYTGNALATLVRVASGQKTLAFQATAGTAYYIRVDSNNGNSADFNLQGGPVPPNDNFASSIALTGSSFSVAGTNFGATRESGEPSSTGLNSVWWNWTAPSNLHVTISTIGSTFTPTLHVFTGTSVSALTPVSTAASSTTDVVTFDAIQGTVYQISVGAGPGNIALALFSAPANDNFANATPLTGYDVNLNGNNLAATKEAGEPNHDGNVGGQSVWYSWTAPSNGTAQIILTAIAPAGFKPVFAVYTGSAVSALTTVISGTTAGGQFTAVAGTVYQIAVDGNTTGTFSLGIQEGPPNDNFANAIAIPDYITVTGSNVNATKETGEPSHAGDPGGTSVWWSFVAPDTRLVDVTTTTSNFDTLLGIYTGTSVSGLTLIASNDNEGVNIRTSRTQFAAVAGTKYYIAVDGKAGATGLISLAIRRADVAITSPLTVSPVPQVATKPVTFTIGTDAPATFIWDFGDGSIETTANSTITHVYATAGNYTVTVTAMEPSGFTVSNTLAITVLASKDLGLTKVGISLDYVKKANDTITASGSIPLAANASLSGSLLLKVNGVTQTLTVVNGAVKLKTQMLRISSSKTGSYGKFTLKIVGDFQSALAPAISKTTANNTPVNIHVEIDFNGVSYQFNITDTFTTNTKKGTAK